MRKILAVAASLLLPLSTYAAPVTWTDTDTGVKGVCASGTCDAPVEAAGLTDGLNLTLTRSRGLVVTVCADVGQTLSGAGVLTAYGRSTTVALWGSMPDKNLPPTTTGRRCHIFDGMYVPVPGGRVQWVVTGVTVSGGGTTVYIEGA